MKRIKLLTVFTAAIIAFGATEFALSSDLSQQDAADRAYADKLWAR